MNLTAKYYHVSLAGYFGNKLNTNNIIGRELDIRIVAELPWQLMVSEFWEQLSVLLVNERYLSVAWNKRKKDVQMFWSKTELNSDFRMIQAYSAANKLFSTLRNSKYLISVAELLRESGHSAEALVIIRIVIENNSNSAMNDNTPENYPSREEMQVNYISNNESPYSAILGIFSMEATCLRDIGNFNEALTTYKIIENYGNSLNLSNILIESLGNQATILTIQGKYPEALELLDKVERLSVESKNLDSICNVMINRASIFHLDGKLEDAKHILEIALQKVRDINNYDSELIVVGNLAMIHQKLNQHEQALEYFRIKEKACRELGKWDSLQITIGNLALLYKDQGKFEESLNLLSEQENICNEIQNPRGLAYSRINTSLVYILMKQPAKAMKYLDSAEELVHKYGIFELEEEIQLNKYDLWKLLTMNLSKISSPATFDVAASDNFIDNTQPKSSIIAPKEIDGNLMLKLANDNYKKGNWEASETLYNKLLLMNIMSTEILANLLRCVLYKRKDFQKGDVETFNEIFDKLSEIGENDLMEELIKEIDEKISRDKIYKKKKIWKFWK